MKKSTYKILFITLGIAILSGCASRKKIIYLQGVEDGYTQQVDSDYEVRIQPNDLIGIFVNSKDPDLVKMFNLPLITYQTGVTNSISQRTLGYLVNKEGKINFPQLGEIKISGLTRTELIDTISQRLINDGFINDPIVTVQFLNFKVSVIGEVARPGTIKVESDRITLFDALTSAGDLTVYGQRDNVKIIREKNGIKTVSFVDLRNVDILTSPFYYLQQNDIVYVEPNKAKAGQREINQNRTVGTWASITSVLLSAISIILSVK